MARSRRRRYREYRGRRGGASTVLKLIVILLAVLLAAALIFTLLMGKYIEYTDEGVRLHFPWGQEASPTPELTEAPVQSDVLVVVTPEPTPEPAPEPVHVLTAVEVTAAHLADGTAAERVREAGGNCLVVEMKNEYGRVNWPTEVKGTIGLPTSVADEAARTVAELAQQGELYLVARVNCFRDQTLSNAQRGGPLMTNGGNVWYDGNGLRWVSPVSEDVCTYLVALCEELAELGFDEILLECAGFPYYGEIHALGTNQLRPEDLSGPVEAFWREMKTALAARNVSLSFLVTGDMITGENTAAGIHAALLANYAERVWTEAGEVDYAALLEQAGMEEAADRLVLIGGGGTGGSALMEGPAR